MKYLPVAAALGLLAAACRPDAPATTEPDAPTTAATVATIAHPADTLHLPDGVVQLLPGSAEEFEKLPATPLPELPNDPAAEPKPSDPEVVRREGLNLLIKTGLRTELKLSSTPEAEFTLQNPDAVKYMYWGELKAAHQWVVKAWYWEADGAVLIDQRTGQLLDVPGTPVTSADGRFVVLTSPGLGGGDQPNTVALVEITRDGPRLRWQREPTAWQAEEARWAHPGITILKVRHLNAQGELPDDAPVSYVKLPMPR